MLKLPEGTNIYHELTPGGKPYVVYDAIGIKPFTKGGLYFIEYLREAKSNFDCYFASKEKRDLAFNLVSQLTINGTIKLVYEDFFFRNLTAKEVHRILVAHRSLTIHQVLGEAIQTAVNLGFTLQEIVERKPIQSLGLSNEDFILMMSGSKPKEVGPEDYEALAVRLAKVFHTPRYITGKGISKEQFFVYLLQNTLI